MIDRYIALIREMASLLLKKRTRDYDDDDDDDNNNTINSTTPSQRSFNIGPTVYNKRKRHIIIL